MQIQIVFEHEFWFSQCDVSSLENLVFRVARIRVRKQHEFANEFDREMTFSENDVDQTLGKHALLERELGLSENQLFSLEKSIFREWKFTFRKRYYMNAKRLPK